MLRAESALKTPSGDRARLAVTSVCLRDRFRQTRKGAKVLPELTLESLPAFIREEFDVQNLEIWSRHFDNSSLEFCQELAGIAAESGCRIVNIQLDGKEDVSAAEASERERGITNAMEWMDRAAACGAGSLRVEVGGPQEFDAQTSITSFGKLAEYGESVGVKVLVENHLGNSRDPATVLAIVHGVDSDWCRSLPDFGNVDGKLSEADRLATLGRLIPDAGLISAKGTGFDADGVHKAYDLGACVALAESLGYSGIYSAEYWPKGDTPLSDLEATRRILDLIVENLATPG